MSKNEDGLLKIRRKTGRRRGICVSLVYGTHEWIERSNAKQLKKAKEKKLIWKNINILILPDFRGTNKTRSNLWKFTIQINYPPSNDSKQGKEGFANRTRRGQYGEQKTQQKDIILSCKWRKIKEILENHEKHDSTCLQRLS